jgi:hypothetical protein
VEKRVNQKYLIEKFKWVFLVVLFRLTAVFCGSGRTYTLDRGDDCD